MPGKIFINYRRGDESGFTQALFGRLEQAFRSEQLFMDVDSIPPGIDFVHFLGEQVAQCDILLAVIGKNWIDARDAANARRLDDPDDFVRIEIESALKQGKRVIPVLVNEARMPRSDELPEGLKPLARRNAVRLTHERFRADAQGLIKAIQQALDDEAAHQADADERRRQEEAAAEHARQEQEARGRAERERLERERAAEERSAVDRRRKEAEAAWIAEQERAAAEAKRPTERVLHRVRDTGAAGSFFAVENLGVRFGGVVAVDGVSFEVQPGEVYTIIGPNGAGKTTIFNLIGLIYPPTSGRILFEDREVTGSPHHVAELGIARTFQNIELFEHATVLQNLLIGRHRHRTTNLFDELLFLPSVRRAEIAQREAVEKVIDLLDLAHYRDSLVAGLPYGVRKVIELGRALATEPKLVLLDEPSSGLNPDETDDMAFWIEDIQKELGITVLMVEHDMNLVSRVSDRVLALNEGRVIAEGTPEQVQSHPAVIEAYLGGGE